MSHLHSTPIYTTQGKVCGVVKGKVFQKSIKGSKHLLRQPPAIAFDVSSLDAAEKAGAESVKVVDQEIGVVYTTTLEHIQCAGFEFSRGFGKQKGLVLSGWSISRRGEIPSQQLELWRGGYER